MLPIVPFWLGAMALIDLVLTRWTSLVPRPRPEQTLILAAVILAAAAVSAARNVALLAVVAAPALSWLWPCGRAVRRHRARPAAVAAYGALALAIVTGAVSVLLQWRVRPRQVCERLTQPWRKLTTSRSVGACAGPTRPETPIRPIARTVSPCTRR
jgi:hypothetical protein